MSITDIAGKLFVPRQKELRKYIHEAEHMQNEVMKHLVTRAENTEYGRNHLFGTINDYSDFAKNIPINTYEELKGDIDRMRHGESNVLWPGTVKWYAKSSGTTNDKSKFNAVWHEGVEGVN